MSLDRFLPGLTRYVEAGIRPGGFLVACLENDLARAVERADPESLALLPKIVWWIRVNVPAGSWGSGERVQDHVDRVERDPEIPW